VTFGRVHALLDRSGNVVCQAIRRQGCWQAPLHALNVHRGRVLNVATIRAPELLLGMRGQHGAVDCIGCWPEFDVALLGHHSASTRRWATQRSRPTAGQLVTVEFAWPCGANLVERRMNARVLAVSRPPASLLAHRCRKLRWRTLPRMLVLSIRPVEGMSGAAIWNARGQLMAQLTGYARGWAGYAIALTLPCCDPGL